MDQEFDRYADDYAQTVQQSIGFAGQDHAFYLIAKAQPLLRLAQARLGDLTRCRALDVGCGVGSMARFLAPHFGSYCGLDTAGEAVRRAARTVPRGRFIAYDGESFPFLAESFDLVVAINVFHHVPIERQARLIEAMTRATRPGGLVAVAEHNPLNPLTRRAVRLCPFDAGVVLLPRRRIEALLHGAGLVERRVEYLLFTPWNFPWRAQWERALGWLPLGAQYLAIGNRPR